MTSRMTTAQALVRFLAAQFSERDGERHRLIAGTWGIFGHGNVGGLGQALAELGDEVGMPFFRPQNEQAQVHVAAAYARHKRRLSTFACTASVGPGSTNMLTGAALATVNRLPVLLLPADYFANRIPDPVLQQVEHPVEHDLSVNDAFRPVSRFFTRISRPEQLLHAMPEAMRVLVDPAETGAVTISLPEDVQAEAYDWPEAFFAERVWRVRRPVPEAEPIAAAAAALANARAPLLVVGGGVKYAAAEPALRDFVEAFAIPVVESQAGKGALPWNHPLNLGPIGSAGGTAANRLAADADVVLAVGTRLGDFVTASKSIFQAPDVQVLGLNVCAMDANKLFAIPIVADAREGLRALHDALRERGYRGAADAHRRSVDEAGASWRQTVDRLRSGQDLEGDPERATGRMAQAEVIDRVNQAVGGAATMICAAGSMPGDLLKLWRPEDPLAYHVEYGYSCMGYEIAAGLGIALADPERTVVVMVGDGSYLMLNSEIVTAVAEGLDLLVVVVDNHGFQSIHGLQRSLGTEHFGLELRHRDADTGRYDGPFVNVDYVAHAASLGATAVRADTPEALDDALADALGRSGVRVVVATVDPERRVPSYAWWDVPVAEVSDVPSVRRARDRYEEGRRDQKSVRS